MNLTTLLQNFAFLLLIAAFLQQLRLNSIKDKTIASMQLELEEAYNPPLASIMISPDEPGYDPIWDDSIAQGRILEND